MNSTMNLPALALSTALALGGCSTTNASQGPNPEQPNIPTIGSGRAALLDREALASRQEEAKRSPWAVISFTAKVCRGVRTALYSLDGKLEASMGNASWSRSASFDAIPFVGTENQLLAHIQREGIRWGGFDITDSNSNTSIRVEIPSAKIAELIEKIRTAIGNVKKQEVIPGTSDTCQTI